jgi:hypothetical protein
VESAKKTVPVSVHELVRLEVQTGNALLFTIDTNPKQDSRRTEKPGSAAAAALPSLSSLVSREAVAIRASQVSPPFSFLFLTSIYLPPSCPHFPLNSCQRRKHMPDTAARKMIPRIISPFVVSNLGGGSGPYTTFFSLFNLDLLKTMDIQSSVNFTVFRDALLNDLR